jgi:hypothetical protein
MLNDLIPAKYRKQLYALLALAALGVTVWQGADGDWKVAVPALVVALSHALAAGNTSVD